MAHIQSLENGKFKAVVEVGTTGHRKRRTKTFQKKSDAEKWMGTKINEQVKGTYVDPTKMTVSQWFEKYLNIKKDDVCSTTYDNYQKRYEAHIKPDIGKMRLQDLHPFHLKDYFHRKKKHGKINQEGGLSENTLKKLYVLINQALKKAKEMKLIKQNPLTPIECPQPKKHEAKSMTKEELYKLLKTAKENDFFMFVFICTILFTGLRRSEALGLEWEDIDFTKAEINVKKTLVPKRNVGAIIEKETKNEASKRKILMSKKLIIILKKYKKWQLQNKKHLGEDYIGDDFNFVFCKPDGTRYYPTSLNKKMKKIMAKADLPYISKIHILRHTFTTLNIKNKITPKVISEMLGHSTITTTLDIYTHVDTEMQKEAVDKLDETIDIN